MFFFCSRPAFISFHLYEPLGIFQTHFRARLSVGESRSIIHLKCGGRPDPCANCQIECKSEVISFFCCCASDVTQLSFGCWGFLAKVAFGDDSGHCKYQTGWRGAQRDWGWPFPKNEKYKTGYINVKHLFSAEKAKLFH